MRRLALLVGSLIVIIGSFAGVNYLQPDAPRPVRPPQSCTTRVPLPGSPVVVPDCRW